MGIEVGSGDIVVIPAASGVMDAAAFTFAFWFRIDSTNGNNSFVYFEEGNQNDRQVQILVKNANGNLALNYRADNFHQMQSGTDYRDNVWRRPRS